MPTSRRFKAHPHFTFFTRCDLEHPVKICGYLSYYTLRYWQELERHNDQGPLQHSSTSSTTGSGPNERGTDDVEPPPEDP